MNTLGYGKVAQTAISAVSHLAVHYGDGSLLHRAAMIAEERNLSKPLVAKVLTGLAQAGIVRGEAGRSGGFRLARKPAEVTFFDVVTVFEPQREMPFCPFGPGWCGTHNPCAVHHDIASMHASVEGFLKGTNFGILEIQPLLDKAEKG